MTQTLTPGIQIDELFEAIDDYFDERYQHLSVVRRHRRLLRKPKQRVRQTNRGAARSFPGTPQADESCYVCGEGRSSLGQKKGRGLM